MKIKMNKKTVLIHIVLIIGSLLMVVPFLWMVLTSGKTISESTQIPPQIFPGVFQVENYRAVWDSLPFVSFYINTGLMIALRVLTSTLFSAMAAFAVAKLSFPGKNLFFAIVLTVFRHRADTDDDPFADLSDTAIFVGPKSGTFEHNLRFGHPRHRLRFRNFPAAPIFHKIA